MLRKANPSFRESAVASEPSPNRTADRVLALLLCTDAIIVVIHFLHVETIYYGSKGYSVGKDGGIGELFQYMKDIWIIIIFLF